MSPFAATFAGPFLAGRARAAFATRAASFDRMTWHAGAHPNVPGWPGVTAFRRAEGTAKLEAEIPDALCEWSDAATAVYIDQR